MKKIIGLVALVAILAVGALFFVKNRVGDEAMAIAANSGAVNVESTQNESGLTESSGVVSGTLEGINLASQLENLLDFFNVPGNEEAVSELKEIIKSEGIPDIDFEYSYTTKHGILGLVNGVETVGDLKIKNPEISEVIREIFGKDEFLNYRVVTNPTTGSNEITLNLADIINPDGEDFKLSGFGVSGTFFDEGKSAQDFGVKIGELSFDNEMMLSGLDLKFDFKKPVNFEATGNFANMMMLENEGKFNVKKFVVKERKFNMDVENFSTTGFATPNGDKIESGGTISFDRFQFSDIAFAKSELDASYVYGKKFYEKVNAIADFNDIDSDKLMEYLLEDGFEISVNKLNLNTESGNNFSAKALFGLPQIANLNDVDRILEKVKLSANLDVDRAFLTELGANESDINGLASFGLLSEKGGKFSLNLSFDNKNQRLNFNDQSLSVPELVGLAVMGGAGLFENKSSKNHSGKFSPRRDVEISKAATNIVTAMYDFASFYTSQEQFIEIDKMTNVSLPVGVGGEICFDVERTYPEGEMKVYVGERGDCEAVWQAGREISKLYKELRENGDVIDFRNYEF